MKSYKHLAVLLSASIVFNISFINESIAQEEKVLNIYNWADYIAPDTIANFEKETGIKVRYDTFEDNSQLNAKLVTKKSGYDIVVPSSDWAKTQIDSGLFLKLDKKQLPNLKNIDPNINAQLNKVDPSNAYLAGYLWGYTTIGINVDKVVKALGKTPVPKNAWELVFNPVYTSKLKSCGIVYLDSATDIMALALNYANKPAYSTNPADYELATNMLKKVRPDIKSFASSGQAELLVNQSVCVAIGWGGDFYRARAQAAEKGTNLNIAPVIPESGALLFIDSMAIPKEAKHPENAHLFINYILRPEVHAAITNATKYANPNKASLQFVDVKIKNDRTLFLEEADFSKLIAPVPIGTKLNKVRQDAFELFKARN
jgi:putrescine transport system substrate-binding protein